MTVYNNTHWSELKNQEILCMADFSSFRMKPLETLLLTEFHEARFSQSHFSR
jgi:hypothetical protein